MTKNQCQFVAGVLTKRSRVEREVASRGLKDRVREVVSQGLKAWDMKWWNFICLSSHLMWISVRHSKMHDVTFKKPRNCDIKQSVHMQVCKHCVQPFADENAYMPQGARGSEDLLTASLWD